MMAAFTSMIRTPALVLSSVLVALAAILAAACAPRPRMCNGSSDCRAQDACVAGRCQPPNLGLAIAEQNDAGYLVRRLVLAPSDVAWVRRGDRASAMPAVFTLGRNADGESILFTRFDLALPKDAKVIEAYLLLMRSDAVDVDPSPISLHAARIVDPWDSRSISWFSQPRTEESRSPSTRVDPSGRSLVRVDVRALVERWVLHDRRDQGIAVIAENATASGMPFAFLPDSTPGEATGPSPAATPSPRLELYVK